MCMRFAFAGFILEVIGLVALIWRVFEEYVSNFGSGVCLVFGFWALR